MTHALAAAYPETPYGPKSEVDYADPGYQDDGKARYPLDSEEHCRAAWSYINMPKNAAMYTAAQLASIKAKIKAAGRQYGIDFADGTKTHAAADLKNVELMRPGTWKLATGNQTFSEQHLHDAARFAQRTGARPSPVKIGHTDPRFTGDGEPALGWLGNLRVEDNNGPVLMGDITGMPDWLAAAAPTAWPDRSVEGWMDYQDDTGETFAFIVDAVALLGVQPPGVSSIKSLRDLPQLVGVAASARRIIARAPMTTAPEAEESNQRGAGRMDPAKIREALGLSADASDDEVSAAVAAEFPVAASPPLFDVGQPAPVAAKQQPGTIVLASSVWDETQKTIKTLTDFVGQAKRNDRDEVIAKAVMAGKFTPAQKKHFSQLWDADPDGTRALINTLMPNSALAVMASGYAGDAEQHDLDTEFAHLFPPTASKEV